MGAKAPPDLKDRILAEADGETFGTPQRNEVFIRCFHMF